MKSAIIIAALLVSQPALGACHIFKHWDYPWPQRCRYRAISFPTPYHRGDTEAALEVVKPRPAPLAEPCPHTGDYNPRDYGLCMLRLELEMYYKSQRAGLIDYKYAN